MFFSIVVMDQGIPRKKDNKNYSNFRNMSYKSMQ